MAAYGNHQNGIFNYAVAKAHQGHGIKNIAPFYFVGFGFVDDENSAVNNS